MTTAELEARGFDACVQGEGYLRIGCTQCDALVIQGVPCHETGCPNATKECAGCWAQIPARAWTRYCEDCQ